MWAVVIVFFQAVHGGEYAKEELAIQEKALFGTYNSFEEETGWKSKLWGRPFRDHFYLGMWTTHLSSGDDQENTNNLLGVSWKGYYAGTFVNTHRDQVYSGGVQRSLFQDKWGSLEVEAGYRTGMMYGYTKYLTLGGSRWFPCFRPCLILTTKVLVWSFPGLEWLRLLVSTIGFEVISGNMAFRVTV